MLKTTSSSSSSTVPRTKRALIPQTLSEVQESLNKDQVIQEGQELFADNLTFERVVYDEKGSRTVITDSIASLKFGTTIILLMPGAGTHTCSNMHLPAFIKQLPEFKKQGVKLAVLTKDNCDVFDKLWLRPSLQQADWIKPNANLSNSPTLVQDYIIGIADISLTILNAWGIEPIEIPRLGLVPPRGMILLHDGKVLKKSIETDAGVCSVSSANTALEILKEVSIATQRPSHQADTLVKAEAILFSGMKLLEEPVLLQKEQQTNSDVSKKAKI